MFVHSFKNGHNDSTQDSFEKYYMKLVEINHLFNLPVKLIEMSRNNEYVTGQLLDYLYHQNYYTLNSIDLSRQTNASIPQEIIFTGNLEKDDDPTITFKSSKGKNSKLFFKFFKYHRKIKIKEHQKILNLLNETNGCKFVTENGILSLIIQNQLMV